MTTTESPILGFLPEPEPREVRYTILSVDDHLVEPRHVFEGRLPAKLQDRAPRVVEDDEGNEVWEFDGQRIAQGAANAVAGLARRDGLLRDPLRYDQMRRGCWDIEARIHDMDLNGVWASMNFPSIVSGFCGRVYSQSADRELGIAVTRAWNDWLYEEWHLAHPERIIPLGITYLADPEVGAEEIRRNAARGFRSVTLPERPHCIGFPSLHSDHWDSIVAACQETETVISLHVGSSGLFDWPEGAHHTINVASFPLLSAHACMEWLFSGLPMRFPDVQIIMAEGGLGWVPMLLDRLDSMTDRTRYADGHFGPDRLSDVLRRNFWFCALEDRSVIPLRHHIGVDRILYETDYPHGDGTWPDSQDAVAETFAGVPDDEVRAICCENAAGLLRHPLPDVVLPAR